MHNFGQRTGKAIPDLADTAKHLQEFSSHLPTSAARIEHSIDVQRRMFALEKAVEIAAGNGREEVLTTAMELEAFLLSKPPYTQS